MNFQTFKLITAPVLEEHGNFELAAKKKHFWRQQKLSRE